MLNRALIGFQNNKALCLSLLFSVLAFGTSIFLEFGYGERPCSLCLWQRWPFLFAIAISLFGIMTRFQIVSLWALVGIFTFEVGISSFHLLVQNGIVVDPCIVPKVANANDFWKMLNAPPPCSKVSWKILGIPASAINLTISLLVTFYNADTALFSRKKARSLQAP